MSPFCHLAFQLPSPLLKMHSSSSLSHATRGQAYSQPFHKPNRILPRRVACGAMSCSSPSSFPTLRTVSIPYSDLKDKNLDLSGRIEEGFGPNGPGILSIADVPGFSSLRQNLLCLSSRLACLPEEMKVKLEDPDSSYNFGWSHGKEKLESGKPDMLKGSFYANPIVDVPTTDAYLKQRYPFYCGSNIWPHDALPELEVAFKALGKLIHDVGLMVAYHCDQYERREGSFGKFGNPISGQWTNTISELCTDPPVSKGIELNEDEGLQKMLLHSRCHKGRLLYYFPAQRKACVQDNNSTSSWCGWHTDHGSLTGLTCAMFKRDGAEIPCPDSAAGLYIKTRTDQIVKAVFGEDEIAYQVGETTEILSTGYLCATPHCVRAPGGDEAAGLDRSTFALFMQPDWDEILNFPKEMHIHRELMLANRSLTFGEYTEKLLDKYYHLKT